MHEVHNPTSTTVHGVKPGATKTVHVNDYQADILRAAGLKFKSANAAKDDAPKADPDKDDNEKARSRK